MRTLEQIEAEERQLKNRLLKLEVEIRNHPERNLFTSGLELDRVLSGQGKRLSDLENEKEAIGLKLQVLDEEEFSEEGDDDASGLRQVKRGELKRIVNELIERDGIKFGETVPSTKINAWIRDYAQRGIQLNASSIRKSLSSLGCSTEKKGD